MKVAKIRAYRDRLKGHKDAILYLYSPDGPEGGMLHSGSADRTIRVWDLVGRQVKYKSQLQRENGDNEITCYCDYGPSILAGFNDGMIIAYDVASGYR